MAGPSDGVNADPYASMGLKDKIFAQTMNEAVKTLKALQLSSFLWGYFRCRLKETCKKLSDNHRGAYVPLIGSCAG